MVQPHGAWLREPHTVVLTQGTTPAPIAGPFAIAVESAYVAIPLEFEPHTHERHELVWVRGGTMTVRVPGRVITVPEGQGLWTPAQTMHSGRTTAGVTLHTAVFDPARSPVNLPEAAAIEVTSLLGELIIHLERDDLADAARMRAEAVVFDVLQPAPQQLALHVPLEDRLRPIVDTLMAEPMDDTTLGAWATRVGTSERTLSRQFRAHTGLSFLQWRQSLRIHHALTMLGEGLEVQEVSDRLGYSQPSTFIASFKRIMGTTPGAYASTDE